MKKNNLLASVALFGELYNDETFKSIPDILAEFIKGAIIFKQQFSVNSTQLKNLLEEVYGFTIPESVLRTTLKHRLKDVAKKESSIFYFDQSISKNYQGFNNKVETITNKQNLILEDLYKYIQIKMNIKLSNNDKENVFENFSHFLMDNGYSDEYSELISAFVISKENSSEFKNELNSIKEGLILYQGINYSADINQLGSWKDSLTIYLSTEHLFNCMGYNGELFKEIFNDLLKLVNEINKNELNKTGKKLVELKFLEETEMEIKHFFTSAELIKKGYLKLDPSKLAMSNILKDCENLSDIKQKETDFFINLKYKGIQLKECSFDIENSKYNIVDQSIVDDLKNKSRIKNMPFKEEDCKTFLNIFTKINIFREGKNNVPFEKIRHIYITENGFAKYLGHNNAVKFENNDIAFAKDIDYVITKFWFKLNKGFKDKAILPKTFDLVNKAKIIMSTHMISSLGEKYDQLKTKFNKKELSEENAIAYVVEYKNKTNTPELITFENIDESLNFIHDDNHIENYIREQTKKDSQYHKMEKELHNYKEKERLQEEKKRLLEEKEKLENQEKESITYANKKWKNINKTNVSDIFYFLINAMFTFFLFILGLGSSLYPPLKSFISSFSKGKIILWTIIIVIIFVYYFLQKHNIIIKKGRIKRGLRLLFKYFNYKEYKNSQITKFKKEFLNK